MTLFRFFLPAFAAASLLSLNSCSMFGLFSSDEPAEEESKDKTGGYADYIASGGSVDATTYDVTTPEDLAKIDNGADGEVYFTDPDAPEEEISEITAAFENKRTGQHWYTKSAQASRIARLRGLPLLIWFHDSTLSPQSKALGRELLQREDFMDWSKDRAVCLCLDAGRGMNDVQAKSSDTSNAHKIKRLQQSYGLKNKPAFVIIAPQGEVVAKIDGFDGYAGALETSLMEGVAQAAKSYEQYKQGLRDKGFRDWQSSDGKRVIFAKLTRFDQKNDILYLKNAAGRQYKVHESKFHDSDVDYIENNLRDGGPKY